MLQLLNKGLLTIFWCVMTSLTGLLAFNALHYLNFDLSYGILPEKPEALKLTIWTVAFYLHMPAGVICLVLPLFLFLFRSRMSRRSHRRLGMIYVLVVLLIVGPTGLIMAPFAKGGWLTQLGFVVQGVLLMFFTYEAVLNAKKRELVKHRDGMIRSYAMATAALSFRLVHIGFYFLKLPYTTNYCASQWVSIVFNLLVAEILIQILSRKSLSTKKQLIS